jgi:hypothetical protein
MIKKKEVKKNVKVQKKESKEIKVVQGLVRPDKLQLRLSEGWKVVKQEGDLTLIEKEI